MTRPKKIPELRGIYGSGRHTNQRTSALPTGASGWDDVDAKNAGWLPNGQKYKDSDAWTDATAPFPNGVPRFESRDACKQFMEEYCTENGGSNPGHPGLMHIFTMCISWEQLEERVFPVMEAVRAEPRETRSAPDMERRPNIYESSEGQSVVDEICERLDVPFHKCTNPTSTMNTFKYLYHHMKCGIFVMIRNGELRLFAPFVNAFDYKNTWDGALKIDTPDGSL